MSQSAEGKGRWTIARYENDEYQIVETNPDAEKKCVSYAGQWLRVANVFDEHDATIIVASPELLEALHSLERTVSIVVERWEWEQGDLPDIIRSLIADRDTAVAVLSRVCRLCARK